MSSDSERLSNWADQLIELNFNFYNFFLIEKSLIRPHLLLFSVPVFLIALCKVFFVNEWQFVFLLLNLTILFLSLIIFIKSLKLMGVRPILISLTIPLIVLSVDILTWPKFILTDMIYAYLVLLATFFVIKGIVKNKTYFFQLALAMLLLLATRPCFRGAPDSRTVYRRRLERCTGGTSHPTTVAAAEGAPSRLASTSLRFCQ